MTVSATAVAQQGSEGLFRFGKGRSYQRYGEHGRTADVDRTKSTFRFDQANALKRIRSARAAVRDFCKFMKASWRRIDAEKFTGPRATDDALGESDRVMN